MIRGFSFLRRCGHSCEGAGSETVPGDLGDLAERLPSKRNIFDYSV